MNEEVAQPTSKVTDAIPRVTLDQLLAALGLLSARERATFDDIRQLLQRHSARRAPGSTEAMWTSARDALAELQRLGMAKTGPLPRKRSEVARLRASPCEATETGRHLAVLHEQKPGSGFDALFLLWIDAHPYFRALIARLNQGVMHVPDVTSVKQIGEPDGASAEPVALRISASCVERLRAVGWPETRLETLKLDIEQRVRVALKTLDLAALRKNLKAWVDLVEDKVVLPAFLTAETLPLDTVTFQHLVRVSQQFMAAAWTSSHPKFTGRVIFSTCNLVPPLLNATDDAKVERHILHHGRAWASERFDDSLIRAYTVATEGRSGAYIDIYVLRALVCTEMGIQPKVFELCLHDFARNPRPGRPAVYTELPMRPPPAGELYVKFSSDRIGLLRLASP